MLKDKLFFAAKNETPPPINAGGLWIAGNGLIAPQIPDSLVFQQIGADFWSEFAMATANQGFAIGIKSNGTLWSAGNNVNARTGLGTTVGTTDFFTQIGTDNNWKTISVPGIPGIQPSNDSAIAVKQDGTLWAWGSNNDNQLGLPGAGPYLVPTQVGTDTDWIDAQMVFSGSVTSASILLKSNGTMWSVGSNQSAITGQGIDDNTETTSITQIGTDSDWAFIAGGRNGCFAIKQNGTLWGWGTNTSQELGVAGGGVVLVPTQESTNGTTWASVSKGSSYAAALKNDGTRWHTGANNNYQAGSGSTTPNPYNAFTQIGVDTWLDVKVNVNNAGYGINNLNELYVWGINNPGQTGRNLNTGTTNVPTQIGTDTDWIKISSQMRGSSGIIFKSP